MVGSVVVGYFIGDSLLLWQPGGEDFGWMGCCRSPSNMVVASMYRFADLTILCLFGGHRGFWLVR